MMCADGRVEILVGDCRETLAALPDASVHCVVTSPPYFGLRDYGHAEQIGLEPTPAEFVAALVAVFRDVRRVLRDDGTVWLNLGDSYASSTKGSGGVGKGTIANGRGQATNAGSFYCANLDCGLPNKQLIGIPWRVAFALQDDGWYLRQDIIWHKPNPMPESVRDRCTKAHEYIFLLSKSQRYYFDQAAIGEAAEYAPGSRPNVSQGGFAGKGADPMGQRAFRAIRETRNRRSVWTIATQPYSGAHFATMPPGLAKPCILAGCPKGGTVLDPFGGVGTTGLVAARHGRRAILCELNPQYARLARDRIAAEWREPPERDSAQEYGPLFAGGA